jgi:hypothetical protein
MENTLPCIREEEFHSITKKINEFLKKKEYEKAFKTFVMEVSKVNKIDMDDFFLYYKKYNINYQ